MLNKLTSKQAPLFYAPHIVVNKTTLPEKMNRLYLNWRINQLQGRIEQIQDALEYELRQNHTNKHQLELVSRAQKMCLSLAHKQQRLLQR